MTGLRQIAGIANPRTFLRLREAGALEPKGSIALARSLPWLLGRGPSLGLVAQMHAVALRDKVAIRDRAGDLTWAELNDRANRAAHLLAACGVQPGERLGLLLRNGREFAELLIGAQKIGVIVCPLNTWAKTKELEATVRNADARVLVYDAAHAEQIDRAAPDSLPLLYVGDEKNALKRSRSYEDGLLEQPTTPPPPFTRRRGSAKVVIHTSGTTGTPKGASRNDAASGSLSSLANLLSIVPFRRDDVVVCPAPMFHSFGLATFTVTCALGATMVLPEKYEPEKTLELIHENLGTAASLVPVMVKRILELPAEVKDRYDLSTLRIVLCSGSALSAATREAAMQLFGDVLYDLYGSTEAGWVTIAQPQDMKARPTSVGKPVPGVEIAVFTNEGARAAPGELGELFVKSGVAFEGYTSGETKEHREGYMSLGDVGYLDEEGYLFVEGRADDMVVVGGENIYPIEVESVIESVPGVSEAAVIGVEDPEYGHVLAAFYAGSAGVEEVRSACRSELASYKVPKKIEKMDSLPRTSTGKVVKRELLASE